MCRGLGRRRLLTIVAKRAASPPGGGRPAARPPSRIVIVDARRRRPGTRAGRRSPDQARTRVNAAESLSTAIVRWKSAQFYLPVGGRDSRNLARRPAPSAPDRCLLREPRTFDSLTNLPCHGSCDRDGYPCDHGHPDADPDPFGEPGHKPGRLGPHVPDQPAVSATGRSYGSRRNHIPADRVHKPWE